MAVHKENVEVYWYLTAPDGRSPGQRRGAQNRFALPKADCLGCRPIGVYRRIAGNGPA